MKHLPKGTRIVWRCRAEFIEESVLHAHLSVRDRWLASAGLAFRLDPSFLHGCGLLDERDLNAERRTLADWVMAHADEFTYSDLCVVGITGKQWAWLVDNAVARWDKARKADAEPREGTANGSEGQGNG